MPSRMNHMEEMEMEKEVEWIYRAKPNESHRGNIGGGSGTDCDDMSKVLNSAK